MEKPHNTSDVSLSVRYGNYIEKKSASFCLPPSTYN